MQCLSWRDYIFLIWSSSTDYLPSLRHITRFTFYYYYSVFFKITLSHSHFECRRGFGYLKYVTWESLTLKHDGNLHKSAERAGLLKRLSTNCNIICWINGAASPNNWLTCYWWTCKYEKVVINERRLETSHHFKEENVVTSVFATFCLDLYLWEQNNFNISALFSSAGDLHVT